MSRIFRAFLVFAWISYSLAVNWDKGDWAFACDFAGQDLDHVLVRGEDCGGRCSANPKCTHYSWTPSNGGTCWLKEGPCSKQTAFDRGNDQTNVCGVTRCQASGSGSPSGTGDAGDSSALITKTEFERAVTESRSESPYPKPTDEQYRNVVSRAAKAGKITTKRELAMFLANVLWESDGLRAKKEYNPGDYPYPQLDVPGKLYYGRGYIQLTWSYNYRDASTALYGDDRLLRNPDQVATDDAVAWDTAFWFWSSRVHDQPGISDGKFGAAVKAINSMECTGADEKRRKRFGLYRNVYRVFGLSGQPDDSGC